MVCLPFTLGSPVLAGPWLCTLSIPFLYLLALRPQFENSADQQQAIEKLHGSSFEGEPIKVQAATRRADGGKGKGKGKGDDMPGDWYACFPYTTLKSAILKEIQLPFGLCIPPAFLDSFPPLPQALNSQMGLTPDQVSVNHACSMCFLLILSGHNLGRKSALECSEPRQ